MSSDSSDIKGLGTRSADGTKAEFLPLAEMHRLINATKLTYWFIDDIGQGLNRTQAALMPWLLERQSGGQKLPDCVKVVAATNGREHRSGVTALLEPVKSRFGTIIHVEPEYSEWRNGFAIPKGISPIITAFLDFQSRNKAPSFNNFVPTSDLTNSPIPSSCTATYLSRFF